MKKILLVQLPPWGICAPPLGVAYLATFLKSHGFDPEILDLNIKIFNDPDLKIADKWDTQDFEFWSSGKAVDYLQSSLNGFAEQMLVSNAAIIGFSATFASVPFLNALLPLLKKNRNDLLIVVGGGGVSSVEGRGLFKKEFIDYFVIGEGEVPLCALMEHAEGTGVIENDVRCLSWKDRAVDKPVCLKTSNPNTLAVDDIPFPVFEEFDLNLYSQKDLLPLISSRGCIRSCVFCFDAPLKKPYRCRNAKKVAEEIKCLSVKYNRKRLEFSDLLLNGNLRFLSELCGYIIEMNLGVCWGGQATIRKDMDAALFKKMKDAGCGGLTFGCESFSDRVLMLMHKGVTAADARETFIKAKQVGMLVEVNLIVGFPGEQQEDIEDTLRFIRENRQWIDRVNSLNICTIGPGMYIYDHLKEFGIEKDAIADWYAWFTADKSNTIEVRLERHSQLLSVCRQLGLSPVWNNVKR